MCRLHCRAGGFTCLSLKYTKNLCQKSGGRKLIPGYFLQAELFRYAQMIGIILEAVFSLQAITVKKD